MDKWNPFSPTYTIKCPDETTRVVYKKVKDAFPLSIEGWEGSFSGKLKSEILDNLELDAKYKTKIEGLLFELDEINRDAMIQFRSVYIGFQSAPCENNSFLLSQIDQINQEQRRLRASISKIDGFIKLVSGTRHNAGQLEKIFAELLSDIDVGDGTGISSVVSAIKSNIEAGKKLIGDARGC